jgi:hypothetical protein
MKKYELPQELGDQVINYLARRPWIEVNELINKLQQLKETEEIKEEK